MPDEVVSDTSPLQYLHQLGLLDILPRFYGTVLIPSAVVQELETGRTIGVDLPDTDVLPWVQVVDPSRTLPVTAGFGSGEAAAIALALERDALVLLDDLGARRTAEALNIAYRGTLSLLIRAKQEAVITAVRPFTEELRRLRFRLDSATEARIIALAGE